MPKNFRKSRQSDSESEEEDQTISRVREVKELQQIRSAKRGFSAEQLLSFPALSHKKPKTEVEAGATSSSAITSEKDLFKLKPKGGLIEMASDKPTSEGDDDSSTQIGTAFAAATNKRDEDIEMLKYVETELAKRRGMKKEEGAQFKSVAEEVLANIDTRLKKSELNVRLGSELASTQMLSGIPEVDLGLSAKIKNIEATEEAKQRLLRERREKLAAIATGQALPTATTGAPLSSASNEFAPTNISVNFVQHSRFNLPESSDAIAQRRAAANAELAKAKAAAQNKQRVSSVAPPSASSASASASASASSSAQRPQPTRGGPNATRGPANERATDDWHYEKFKQQFRFRR